MTGKYNDNKDIPPSGSKRARVGQATLPRKTSTPRVHVSLCDTCPDMDKHCYECAHQHRRWDTNECALPHNYFEKEDEAWGF